MGLLVRDATNQNEVPSFSRLFVRNLFLILWPVEFIVLAISKEKQRIGDSVAKTIVLKNPNKSSKSSRLLALISLLILFFIFLFVYVGSSMKNSEPYKISIVAIETDAEIQTITGGIIDYGIMPTGNVSVGNGIGEATFEISVKGKLNDIQVKTVLSKEKDEKWKLISLEK